MPSVAQLISFLVDYRLDLDTAMHLPRVNATGSGKATVDPQMPADTIAAIAARIETVPGERAVYPVLYAAPQVVTRDSVTGTNAGAAEPSLPWSGAVAEKA